MRVFLLRDNRGGVSAEPVLVAVDGEVRMPVVVSEEAGDRVRSAAATPSDYLRRISGGDVSVKTGDGSNGIVLGTEDSCSSLPFEVDLPDGVFRRETYRKWVNKRSPFLRL